MTTSLDNLLLNKKTGLEAQAYLERPAHALMIVGLPGSGKTTLATTLAAEVLKTNELANYPYFLHIKRPDGKKDIPIEDIRAVLHKLRLRTPGKQIIRRIVFIEDAHLMSAAAQNALLKSIEEPASDTIFILTVHSPQGVLPTIASRAQALNIQPVAAAQTRSYYQSQKTEVDINNAWQLAQGQAGLLHALLFDSEEHPLKNAVGLAKNLLQKNSYERILELDKLSKDKEQLFMLLIALGKVLTALHRAAAKRGSSRQGALIAGRRLVNRLEEALEANTSPKLVALELALNLKV